MTSDALYLYAGDSLDVVQGQLAEVLSASTRDSVEVRCPAPRRGGGTCGKLVGMVMDGPVGSAAIAVRRQPNPVMLSEFARLARLRWPDRNPKAADRLLGACWLLAIAPDLIAYKCPRCGRSSVLTRDELLAAHRRSATRTIITAARLAT